MKKDVSVKKKNEFVIERMKKLTTDERESNRELLNQGQKENWKKKETRNGQECHSMQNR